MSPVAEAIPTTAPPAGAASDPIERARAITGADGRGLYQALIEKLVTFGDSYVATIPLAEYRAHLPTTLQVEPERALRTVWNLAYDLERYDDVGGFWTYPRLLEVWTHCNNMPSPKKLKVSKVTGPRYFNAPWHRIEPIFARTSSPESR
jgi:hypothetical protein